MEGLEASSLLEVGNKAEICRVEVGLCKLSEAKEQTLTGALAGALTGTLTGTLTEALAGTLTGALAGTLAGTLTGALPVWGTLSGAWATGVVRPTWARARGC